MEEIFEDRYEGETILPFTYTLTDSKNQPTNLVGAQAELHLRQDESRAALLRWSTAENTITAAGNVLSFTVKTAPVRGVYRGRLMVTLGNGIKRVTDIFKLTVH